MRWEGHGNLSLIPWGTDIKALHRQISSILALSFHGLSVAFLLSTKQDSLCLTWSVSLDISPARLSGPVVGVMLPLCFRKFFLMHIQQYCQRRVCSFFLPFFPSHPPFPFLSLSLHFLSYCPVLPKLLNLGGMGSSLLTPIHRSSSMIAPCFSELWIVLLSSLCCIRKCCCSPLKLLHILLSTSFDALQLWMRIGAVKFVGISLQLEVARRDPSDRQKWN